MSLPNEFDAYLAYFNQLSTEALLDFLQNHVPQAQLSQDSLAFLQAFGNRLLAERQAREQAENDRLAQEHAAQQATAAAQAAQAQAQAAQQQATQAAGLGTAGQYPNGPSQSNPQFNQHTVGGRSSLAQAMQKGLKPPTFDGSKVIDWIFKINQYLNALDSSAPDSDKLSFAVNLLTGKALTWWRHKFTFGLPYYQTFNDFTNDLYDQFVDVDHVNRLREQIDTLVQSKGQAVQKYIARFKEVQVELGPHALSDDQAKYRFIKGLSQEIRVFTNMSNPPTFQDACQAAAMAEQSLKGTLGQGNARGSSDRMDLGSFFATQKQKSGRKNGAPQARQNKGKSPAGDAWKRDATCHHCGKRGHIKPDCRQLKAQQGTGTGGNSRGRHNQLEAQVQKLQAELAALRTSKPSTLKN